MTFGYHPPHISFSHLNIDIILAFVWTSTVAIVTIGHSRVSTVIRLSCIDGLSWYIRYCRTVEGCRGHKHRIIGKGKQGNMGVPTTCAIRRHRRRTHLTWQDWRSWFQETSHSCWCLPVSDLDGGCMCLPTARSNYICRPSAATSG